MKLTKTKKDIIESIKSASSKKKNEEFDFKVQAVADPAFVHTLDMSEKRKQMIKDRMKEKEKEKKDFLAQSIKNMEKPVVKTDAMKKMKMVEAFLNESFKDKLTIKENVFTVLTKSRAELKTLIENARNSGVKYTIGRLAENYEFKYTFEILNEDKVESKSKTLKEDIEDDVVDQFFVLFEFTENGKTKKELHGPFEDEEIASEFADSLPEKENGIFWIIEPHEVNTIDMTESKDESLKEDKKDTDKKADLQKEISWCKSVLNNPKGKAAMDAKANYGKDYVAQVKRDLMGFEKQLKQLDESKKTIKEGLTDSKYKALIGEHFDHSFDFEFLDIVATILDRIDFDSKEDLDDEIDVAINDSLIYDEDQWTVAKFYVSSPADLDWDDVLNDLSNDIHELAEKITEGTEQDDEEDEIEELQDEDTLED